MKIGAIIGIGAGVVGLATIAYFAKAYPSIKTKSDIKNLANVEYMNATYIGSPKKTSRENFYIQKGDKLIIKNPVRPDGKYSVMVVIKNDDNMNTTGTDAIAPKIKSIEVDPETNLVSINEIKDLSLYVKGDTVKTNAPKK